MKRVCVLHNSRRKPDVCRNWPSGPNELLAYPDCTYYFEDGKLMGECKQCGECCLKPYIMPPGYNRKFRDERCPHLKDIN